MYQIDNDTAANAAPVPPAPAGEKFFTDGNPNTATPATIVDDWWLNMLQAEIRNICLLNPAFAPDKTDNAQAAAAIRSIIRIRLTVATTFYVSIAGDDNANAGTQLSPWRTVQHAVNLLASSYDLNGQIVTIRRLDSLAYTDPVSLKGQLVGQAGSAGLIFEGNSVTPANVKLITTATACYTLSDGAACTIQNHELSTVTSGSLVNASGSSIVVLSNMRANTSASSHWTCTRGSTILCQGATPYTVLGGAPSGQHIQCTEASSFVANSSQTITFAAGVYSFLTTVIAYGCSIVDFGGSTTGAATINVVGTVSGLRYNSELNGCINTVGSGATYIPGASSGITPNGGTYA